MSDDSIKAIPVKDEVATVNIHREGTPAPEPKANEPEYVPKKAYEEVTSDMHKFKNRYKETRAKLNELETQIKAIEDGKLKEKEQWKELYEKAENEKAEAVSKANQQYEKYVRAAKVSALNAELGGKVRGEYLSLANLEGIQMNEDGTLSSESVREVANIFRQEHPQLVPQSDSGRITSQAPAVSPVGHPQEKSLSEMSLDERVKMLNEMRAKKLS